MGGSSSSFDFDEHLKKDKVQQSVEVKDEDEEYKGMTVPRRNRKFQSLVVKMFPEEDGGVETVWGCFLRGVSKFPDNPCAGTRVFVTTKDDEPKYVKDEAGFVKRGAYVYETYKEMEAAIRPISLGLAELGIKAGDSVGIFSINRAEWQKAALACYSQSFKVVSLYATLGPDAVSYIIDHAEASTLFSTRENLPALIKCMPDLKCLKNVIMFDYNKTYNNVEDVLDDSHVKACEELGVKLMALSDLQKLGSESKGDYNPPKGDDLAMIMYTSGTTGVPKGALLSHINIVCTCGTVNMTMSPTLNETDSTLSYLPLAHIFATVIETIFMAVGGRIGYFQGNIKKLVDDLQGVKPTVLAGVPRVYTKFYQKIMSGVSDASCLKKFVFNKAYSYNCDQHRKGLKNDPKYDAKIFAALRKKLGLDDIRYMITGAAPCPAYLMEFLKVLGNCNVVQGYGMTESAAGMTVCLPNDQDPTLGHVGTVVPCCEIRLVDVPEMSYLSTDKLPRGEVQCRGANVFNGYYKNPEATKSTILEGGWLATGDIGRWNANGTLSIIDRKKNIFKLSQGEYVAAEKVEQVYGKCPYVGQLWVYGNSFKSFVLAVIVPNAEKLVGAATAKGWWKCDAKIGSEEWRTAFNDLCQGAHKDEVKALLMTELKGYTGGLHGFEKFRDIIVESNIDENLSGFSEANGLCTPTFKMKRPMLLKRYIKDLKELYAKNGEKGDEKWPGED